MGGDLVVPAGGGETITSREAREVVLLAAWDGLAMTWSRYGPGERGPDPHVHLHHADAFYVLEGELAFALGPDGERARLGAGGFAAIPPNVIHSFANEGDADARFLNFHSPDGGFAEFMRAARDGDDLGFDSVDPPADGGEPAATAVIDGKGEGERLVAGNRVALLKGVLPEICLSEFAIEGRFAGPDLHRHEDEVDSFYVLEGELEVTAGEELHTAGPGTLASFPPGTWHRFGHPGEGRVRFLNVHTPASGFDEFLRRVSAP
jgi:quercetin dioxygenase-like cupin family protein